jgi:hypothetical protein
LDVVAPGKQKSFSGRAKKIYHALRRDGVDEPRKRKLADFLQPVIAKTRDSLRKKSKQPLRKHSKVSPSRRSRKVYATV